ncbi:hypothetical protein KR009_005087 [Drosophila setifemur]|nr:hypothetical protein KR009_005087 [Drosophila setifemur]
MAKMHSYMRAMVFLTGILFLMYFGLHPMTEMYGGEKSVPLEYQDVILINTSKCHLTGRRQPGVYSLSIELIDRLRCRKPQLLVAESRPGGNFLMPRQISMDFLCQYWLLTAVDVRLNRYLHEGHFHLRPEANIGIPIGTGRQIVRTQCWNNLNESKYHDVHFFFPPPDSDLTSKSDSETEGGSKKLSVMVLGIDSISQMSFLRHFPYVNAHLNTLPHTKLFGYSRVGTDAYANLLPLLSGMNTDELALDGGEESFKTAFDKELGVLRPLWESYKEAGYRTAYGEDNAQSFASRIDKWLLSKTVLDLDLRPVMLEMDQHTRYSIDIREVLHCSAGRPFQEVLRDFIGKLVPHLQKHPFFSFFWESQGVQDYYELTGTLDVPYLMILKRLEEADVLNRTLVLLMSDHGLRKGTYRLSPQGMQEESEPLLVAIYPEWLERKYPKAIANLRSNTRRMVTPYDLHATLEDVLDPDLLQDAHIKDRMEELRSSSQKNMPRGISLFLPIPDDRTCDQAGISSLFCVCRNLTALPTDDGLVVRSSRFLVRSINSLISSQAKCREQKLHKVLQAHFVNFGEDSFIFELKLRIKTFPGNGVFEATVRLSNELILTSPINRITPYLGNSYCVSDPYIKTMCFCLN